MSYRMGYQTDGLPGARRFARFPIALPVIGRVGQSPEQGVAGVVRTVGAGGLMAEFPVRMLPGSAVGLVLQRRHGPLTMEGRVVWTSGTGGKIRHGFAFRTPQWSGFAMDLFLDEHR
ncbi:MAG: PilZ domain-containing protein [Candidatus Methylomirabilales bacterium]